jgi:rSAM/selenodomain-associated transferase 1
MKNQLLIIFAKNTSSGNVKSRLARSIGERKALEIYLELSRRIQQACARLTCDVEIHYFPTVEKNDHWEVRNYNKFVQTGNDIGQRMHRALTNGFAKGYGKICVIGTDIYDLRKSMIESAFDVLSENDIVIGPSRDGGYYLIGMKKSRRALFEGIPWSTGQVLEDTIKKVSTLNLSHFLLPPLLDVDTLSDLQQTDLMDIIGRS